MNRYFFLCLWAFAFAHLTPAGAQDALPPPSLLIADDGEDAGNETGSVQFSHAFSIRLRPDYCYHGFVMAYDHDDPITDIHLSLHLGSGGSRVGAAHLRFASLGGRFIDHRHLTFGYNAPCRVDEVRVIDLTATRDGQPASLSDGLTMTAPMLSQMAVTMGGPIPESGAGDFRGANIPGADLAEGSDAPTLRTLCLFGVVNLRAGPSTQDAVITSLNASTQSPIRVGITGQAAGGDWYAVKTPAGDGFLFAQLLGECP